MPEKSMLEGRGGKVFVCPGRPAGMRWSLHVSGLSKLDVDVELDVDLGDVQEDELAGFENFWEAWAFAVCNDLPDPVGSFPGDNARKSTLRPPEKQVVGPVQGRLFE